jgi:hypothetical protein
LVEPRLRVLEPELDLARAEPEPDLLVLREPEPDLLVLREPEPDLLVLREPEPDPFEPREPDPDLLVLRELERPPDDDDDLAGVGFFARGPLKTSSNFEYSRSLS